MKGSSKFLLFVVVGLILIIGFGIFPAVDTMFGTIDTTGTSTEINGIMKFAPYFFGGVILYAGYCVYRNRSGG